MARHGGCRTPRWVLAVVGVCTFTTCGGGGGDNEASPKSPAQEASESASDSTASTTTEAETTTTTEPPAPADGDVLWRVGPDPVDVRQAALIGDRALLEMYSGSVVNDFSEPTEPSELHEYGEPRSFVLVDATTGETLTAVARTGTDSADGGSNTTGRISQTALLAADIATEQLPAEGLDPERTASAVVLWDMETGDERWRIDLGPGDEFSGLATVIAVTDEVVIVDRGSAPTADLRAYSTTDGTEVWSRRSNYDRFQLSPTGEWLALVDGGGLNYNSDSEPADIQYSVTDTATGAEVSRRGTGEEFSEEEMLWASPNVLIIHENGRDPRVAKMGANGLGEEHLFEGNIAVGEHLAAVANADESRVFLDTGQIRAIDPVSGAVAWEIPESTERPANLVAARGGDLVVNVTGGGEDQGVALDEETGEQSQVIQGAIPAESVGDHEDGRFLWSSGFSGAGDEEILCFASNEPVIAVGFDGSAYFSGG